MTRNYELETTDVEDICTDFSNHFCNCRLRCLRKIWSSCLAVVMITALTIPCLAQELDPRRWTHLPIGTNFAAGIYGYTEADISFDPVLRVENANLVLHSWGGGYIRTFKLLDKSARIGLVQGYMDGRWTGLVDGVDTVVKRSGFTDSIVRFAISLYGAPPLGGKDFAAYRAEKKVETLVGLAVSVKIPTGEYMEDKLINLGSNRFSFKPQLGIVHNRGKWSFETTVATSFYTHNNEFFGGNKLEQDPFVTIQSHVVYNFRPGLWVAASGGYGYGGESKVNGEVKDDYKENVAWALSFGYPITPSWGIKVAYIDTNPQRFIGVESGTVAVALSTYW